MQSFYSLLKDVFNIGKNKQTNVTLQTNTAIKTVFYSEAAASSSSTIV
jgi:hypothetical protein